MPYKTRDIHQPTDFFEYVRLTGADSIPPADERWIDVALLDMNHSWPNIGHDSLVHAIVDGAESQRALLTDAGVKVRVLSYDVRRQILVPEEPGDRFRLYVATGGPGHLDPRENDGVSEWSQGIDETTDWEAPLFRLFDSILVNEDAALFAVCHSFGLLCRWSGIARVVLRGEEKGGKSSGMPFNVLAERAHEHPWFGQFAASLPDHEHLKVVDNRLFDLIARRPDLGGHFSPIGYELSAAGDAPHDALTMVEFARDREGAMPRFLGVNFHPEIVDREHIMAVLSEKHAHGEVSEQWYRERADTMRELFEGDNERQSQLTSHYSLLGPLQFQLARLIRERCADRVAATAQ